ncbi:MAG: L,D-transpeptidase family protein [Acutalibacteraceae bacterium]|nr:L,D-transpeptidase family protein [Acutalibacteraceae bacterium]
MKKKYIKKVIIVAVFVVAFGAFCTVVSADNKDGCVDIFDAKDQTKDSVTLQWDKGINADGYAIYRKENSSDGDYSELAVIENADTTALMDTSVKTATKYDYQIRTYSEQSGKRIYSKGEYIKTASSPLAVENFSLEAQNEKSITLKWSEVKNATGYTVYRMDYQSGGEYKKVCDVKGMTQYTDKGLTPSHKYYYYVKAYIEVDGEKSYSTQSDVIKTATNPSQVQNLVTEKKGEDSIKIKWDKSPNASGYVVYRMTNNENDYEGEWVYDDVDGWVYSSKVGKYIKYAVINDVNKTSYTDKNLNECQNYNYRIVPYYKADNKYCYGDYRTLVTGTVTETPEATVFSRACRLMAKWYPVDGADGYAVYVAESKDGHYKLQGTTDDTIFLTEQKTPNKTYYIRVCAYYEADDKTKIYSNYTTQELECQRANKVDKYTVGTTYIEIDLDMQHMWYFENGKLVVSTPVVTGLKYGRDTSTGLYDVYNKESPARLVGESWDTYVNYWLAVTYDGIGIHDSTWRSNWEYGGNTYTYDGSHGCINTPYDKVEELYELVEVGTPVVIYEKSEEDTNEE